MKRLGMYAAGRGSLSPWKEDLLRRCGGLLALLLACQGRCLADAGDKACCAEVGISVDVNDRPPLVALSPCMEYNNNLHYAYTSFFLFFFFVSCYDYDDDDDDGCFYSVIVIVTVIVIVLVIVNVTVTVDVIVVVVVVVIVIITTVTWMSIMAVMWQHQKHPVRVAGPRVLYKRLHSSSQTLGAISCMQ